MLFTKLVKYGPVFGYIWTRSEVVKNVKRFQKSSLKASVQVSKKGSGD